MMTELMTSIDSQIENATVEEALAGLREWVISQTNQMVIGARWILRLDELGVAVECISEDMQLLLRQIGRGNVAPEAVARFSTRVNSLHAIATLSIEDQRRIGNGDKLPVAEIQNGELTYRMVDPLFMTTAEFRQVVRGGKIIPWERQLGPIESRTKARSVSERCRANKKTGQLIVGRTTADPAEVRAALGGFSKRPLRLADPDDCVSRKMCRELVELLDVLALERQCTRDEFIYRLILQAGV